jgi:hypothetical protein
MRITLLMLALASVARCQTPVPQLAAKALPNFFLAGGEYNSASAPHFSGFAAMALPVSTSVGLYSYSMYQALVVKGKLTTSTTTGVADNLKTFCWKPGCFALVGLAAAGAATSTSANLAAATGGGGVFMFSNGWAVAAFGIQNTVGGVTKPAGLIGFGRTW